MGKGAALLLLRLTVKGRGLGILEITLGILAMLPLKLILQDTLILEQAWGVLQQDSLLDFLAVV